MNKSELMEMALEKLVGDMDDLEGSGAMAHSTEDCPDPLGCTMHEAEAGDSLSSDAKPGDKPGLPSMKGTPSKGDGEEVVEEAEGAAEDGLSAEEAEELRKLLK
jgi:hypothetical protein